jgi:hypothetical protein
MNANKAVQEAIAKMSKKEKRAMFPPITRKNFAVRESWYGRNQIISFINDKGETITYDHDIALDILERETKIKSKPAWKKYGYWSQSTNIPMILRFNTLLDEEDAKKFDQVVKPKATK